MKTTMILLALLCAGCSDKQEKKDAIVAFGEACGMPLRGTLSLSNDKNTLTLECVAFKDIAEIKRVVKP
jgi:hypothetical protein